MNKAHCLFVVAEEFDEQYFFAVFDQLKRNHIQVSLVSSQRKLVTGQNGLKIFSDYYFSELENVNEFNILAFPEAKSSAVKVFADPRIIDLMISISRNGGKILSGPSSTQLMSCLPEWGSNLRNSIVPLPTNNDSTFQDSLRKETSLFLELC